MMHLNFNLRGRLINSFWLWFAASIMAAQIFMLFMVIFVLMRPSAEAMGQTMVALYDAISQIEQMEGAEGVKKLTKRTYSLDHFAILDKVPKLEDASFTYPTIKAFASVIEAEDRDMKVSYSDSPIHSAYFYKSTDPSAVFRISLTEPPFVERYVFWSILTTLIVSIFAAWGISKRLASPIEAISSQAQRIAQNPHEDPITVSSYASPEIQTLTGSINDMRLQLNRSIDEREQFLAMVSHDLRTPLSRMSLWLDVENANSEELRTHLHSDIAEMRSFLEQYVELAKLNVEVSEPWMEGDLSIFLTNIRDRYLRANDEIFLEAQPNLFIFYKPVALTRLIYNLIDNAFRYGTGDVSIEAGRSVEGIFLRISNPMSMYCNVLGVTNAFRESEHGHGAGLGNKIVNQFAVVHGASIIEKTEGTVHATTILFKPR